MTKHDDQKADRRAQPPRNRMCHRRWSGMGRNDGLHRHPIVLTVSARAVPRDEYVVGVFQQIISIYECRMWCSCCNNVHVSTVWVKIRICFFDCVDDQDGRVPSFNSVLILPSPAYKKVHPSDRPSFIFMDQLQCTWIKLYDQSCF